MKRLQTGILPVLCVLIISVFPVLFMYFSNADEVAISETYEPMVVFALIGMACYLICLLFSRAATKAAVTASLFMLFFTNYIFIEKGMRLVFPFLRYWHIVPIVFVVWVHLAFCICKFVTTDVGKDITSILCLVFGGLLLFNLVLAVPAIIEKNQNDKHLAQSVDDGERYFDQTASDMPNVYLLLFDEYAGFEQLREYYQYENAALRGFLDDNRFTVSLDSHNESVQTATICTNLVNLDYIVSNETSASEKELLRKQGTLFELMRQHGYEVNIVESIDFFGMNVSLGTQTTNAAVTINGEDLAYLCYQRTAIYPFVQLNTSSALKNLLAVTDYISEPTNIPQHPTFVLSYVCFPHQPFVVDENGNAIPFAHSFNWKDTRYYLGQLKYATKLMLRMLENIVKEDPDAIILLQSDHGARAWSDPDLFMQWFPYEVMATPLNAIYYRGEPLEEIKGTSTLNTLRIVLSRLFDEQYDPIDVPEYR